MDARLRPGLRRRSASPSRRPPAFLSLAEFLRVRLGLTGTNSKAVGEPPLLLGVSVWARVKHALSFVCPGRIPCLDLPATPERIVARIAELIEGRTAGDRASERASA